MKFKSSSAQKALRYGRFILPGILHRSPYTDNDDRSRHSLYIRALADETHEPIEEIALLYKNVLMHLKAGAKVPDFLPIFVAKKVKQRFREHFAANHSEAAQQRIKDSNIPLVDCVL